MDGSLVDSLVLLFAVVYYAFLVAVYVIRAHGMSELELRLAPVFSVQLVPFGVLWALAILRGESGRIFSLAPIIAFLVYDLWYRLITRRKPQHHPESWPWELRVYLILLMAGSVGLNWYGYIVSELYGRVLVACFFVMMGSFGYYQYMYRKSSAQ
jgi:hypothetical protein